MQTVDPMEVDFAAMSSDQATNRKIARAQPLVQRHEFRLRLDDDALPAAFIEPERHVVGNRMPGTDIDIGPSGLSREGKREMIVLEYSVSQDNSILFLASLRLADVDADKPIRAVHVGILSIPSLCSNSRLGVNVKRTGINGGSLSHDSATSRHHASRWRLAPEAVVGARSAFDRLPEFSA